MWDATDIERGLDALRRAVLARPRRRPTRCRRRRTSCSPRPTPRSSAGRRLPRAVRRRARRRRPDVYGDAEQAASSEDDEAERARLIALVELARQGDTEAFGLLYDHYQPSVYRFLYYRTRSVTLAEDLTSETFFRALRSMNSFRWQGKDFGAWLMTIARNLTTDHFKAGRTRLELTTEDMTLHDDVDRRPRGRGAGRAHQRDPAQRAHRAARPSSASASSCGSSRA